MFNYIHVKNYKSLGDVTFDLRNKTRMPKKLAIVFGDNGIGKSNLASVFYFLSKSLTTMGVRDLIQDFLKDLPPDVPDEILMSLLKDNYQSMPDLIKKAKMVQSDENLFIEYGFRINGINGEYRLEMNDEEIVSESLEYKLNQRKGTYFSFTPSQKKMSAVVFKDADLVKDLFEQSAKFWGKHSFLAILLHDFNDKSQEYYEGKLSDNFIDVLHDFRSIYCKINFGNTMEKGMEPMMDWGVGPSGYMAPKNESMLDFAEKVLNRFLPVINHDIKRVYYKRKIRKSKLHYQLYEQKLINGKVREISFALESTGTCHVLNLLPYLVEAVKGSVVVIDEFDFGMHELLTKKLIQSLYNQMQGQLIVTTHDTNNFELDIPPEAYYVINEDENGFKKIYCVLKIDNKINPKNNIRKQYLSGKYHGIPQNASIDFQALLQMIEGHRGE